MLAERTSGSDLREIIRSTVLAGGGVSTAALPGRGRCRPLPVAGTSRCVPVAGSRLWPRLRRRVSYRPLNWAVTD